MRSKKYFSFDEEKDAENIINNGFSENTIDYSQMYVVAKYFREKFKYGEVRLERELIKFCKRFNNDFNPVTEGESIKKWIKSAMNYELRKIKELEISKKDIDFLKTIEKTNDRKILFATLILAKALKKRNTKVDKSDFKTSPTLYIHYNNFSDILRLTGLKNMSDVKLARLLNKYKKYITLYSPEKELIRLDFIDTDVCCPIIIKRLDNIMLEFDLYLTGNKTSFVCELCGKETIRTNNNQKRCTECSKEVRNKRQKELMRKKRQAQV